MTDFATSIERLHNHVQHWEQSRWWARTAAGTRGELVYALVQRLADLGADAEHRDRRPVPREPDLVLPDQLRVMSDDLLAADPTPAILALAATATTETHLAL